MTDEDETVTLSDPCPHCGGRRFRRRPWGLVCVTCHPAVGPSGGPWPIGMPDSFEPRSRDPGDLHDAIDSYIDAQRHRVGRSHNGRRTPATGQPSHPGGPQEV